MSHYKPYPAYKDSGVEWLGKVPEHWEIKPIKSLANSPGTCFIDGDWIESKNLSESGIRYITTGNVGPGIYKEQGAGYISEATFNELQCVDVRQGDILVSRLNPPIGRACIVPDLGGRVVTSVDNVILRPSDGYLSKYVVYRFSAADYFHEMGLLASGATMQRVSRSELGNVRVAWPSDTEQVAITEHLDRETARIDALITRKTRFIELLREKRQALITHAVTRGLDPSVKMKDSGVDWLGAVPEGWPVVRFRDLCASISTGPFGTALGNDDYVSGGVPVINPSHIVSNRIVADPEVSVSSETASRLSYWLLAKGDLIAARRGELGRAAVVTDAADGWVCGTGSLRVKPNTSKSCVGYLHMVLQSQYAREWLNQASVGATMPNLNEGILGSLPVVFPPDVTEQMRLVVQTEDSLRRIDALTQRSERSIELLKERRSALITAAVTGQIDLREVG